MSYVVFLSLPLKYYFSLIGRFTCNEAIGNVFQLNSAALSATCFPQL